MRRKQVEIRKFSGFGVCEILQATRKNSCLTNKKIGIFDVSISKKFKSLPTPLAARRRCPDRNYSDLPRHKIFRYALQSTQVPPLDAHLPNEQESIVSSSNFYEGKRGWRLKQRRARKLPEDLLKELKKLYDEGNASKARRWSGDKAQEYIMSNMIRYRRDDQLRLTPVRAKSFFSTSYISGGDIDPSTIDD